MLVERAMAQAEVPAALDPATATAGPAERHVHRKKHSPKKTLAPKKGGHGTRGLCAVPSVEEELEADEALPESPAWDEHDPNYDSEAEDAESIVMAVTEYPQDDESAIEELVTPHIKELFDNGDAAETASNLAGLDVGGDAARIPFVVVRIALERHAGDRELASQLLSGLAVRNAISQADMRSAFNSILEALDDLQLDSPDAAEAVGRFLARAVADDCLPPAFVDHHPSRMHKSEELERDLAHEALVQAHALLTMRGGMSKLDSIWGVAGPCLPMEIVVQRMNLLLDEFLSSEDVDEAERCLVELDVPHFHHEFVYEAVLMAMDKSPDARAHILDLLTSLAQSNRITPNQMETGFRRLFANLPDVTLDIPHAPVILGDILFKGVEAGMISQKLASDSPCKGRKRYLSENDGGRIKE